MIRLHAHAHLTHLYMCGCTYSIRGYECLPAHTDHLLMNVCEETVCKIQGVSANLPQVLVSRIPPVSINKRPK